MEWLQLCGQDVKATEGLTQEICERFTTVFNNQEGKEFTAENGDILFYYKEKPYGEYRLAGVMTTKREFYMFGIVKPYLIENEGTTIEEVHANAPYIKELKGKDIPVEDNPNKPAEKTVVDFQFEGDPATTVEIMYNDNQVYFNTGQSGQNSDGYVYYIYTRENSNIELHVYSAKKNTTDPVEEVPMRDYVIAGVVIPGKENDENLKNLETITAGLEFAIKDQWLIAKIMSLDVNDLGKVLTIKGVLVNKEARTAELKDLHSETKAFAENFDLVAIENKVQAVLDELTK